MDQMTLREARRRLSEILDDVERGKSVVITRHGRPVARVSPVEPDEGKQLPDLTEFRKSIRVKGEPLSKTVVRLRRQERY